MRISKAQKTKLIDHAVNYSDFLRNLLISNNELKNILENYIDKPFNSSELQNYLSNKKINSEQTLNSALRQARQLFYSLGIVRDINGMASLEEIFQLNCSLAETFLHYAHDFYLKELTKVYGSPQDDNGKKSNLIIVGMGKLGGYELNSSSDIDIIFLYDSEGQTSGKKRISNEEFFTLLSKKIINTFTDYSEEGILFRVDTRLRPFGSEGLLTLSTNALESYLESHGLDWERYAWLKSRVLIGPSEQLNKIVKPFVYRQYLDFNVFESLRKVKNKINTDMVKRINDGDIKVGHGGIRTCEFIVQAYQIVYGGKDKELQCTKFHESLSKIQEKNLINTKEGKSIHEAYDFLRKLEHRLQYKDDQQTHKLPDHDEDKLLIALSMGFKNWQDFYSSLVRHQTKVGKIFDDLLLMTSNDEQDTSTNKLWLFDSVDESLIQQLQHLGFNESEDIAKFIVNFKKSSSYLALAAIAKDRLDKLAPMIIEKCAHIPEQTRTLVSFFNFIDKLSKRSSYLSLLRENPDVLDLLLKITSFDPEMIESIIQSPTMIDDLMSPSSFLDIFDLKQAQKLCMIKLNNKEDDVEAIINELRNFKNSTIFKIAVQEMMGIYPVEDVADTLSDVADFIIDQLLKSAWRNIYPKKKYPPLAVIAYGKLGGKEMSYLSDLDLVFIYEESNNYTNDEYIRLIQRVNSWATTYTGSGILYEIDLRLRPDGGSGLMVSSWSAFEEYQLKRSLSWEHQALCKARFSSGNEKIKPKFDRLRKKILSANRNIKEIKSDIVMMRERIYENKKPSSELFDLKHSYGGMVEIEFMTQFYVLAYSHLYKELHENSGNIALLNTCSQLGLIIKKDSEILINAYRQFRSLQHRQGLTPDNPRRVPYEQVKKTALAVHKIWNKFKN